MLLVLAGCDGVFGIAAFPRPTGPDAMPGPPTYLSFAAGPRSTMVSNVTFTMPVPDGADRLLIVAVETAMYMNGGLPPAVDTITANGILLSSIGSVSGTTARAEQWMLVAPPVGSAQIAVMLAGPPTTIHAHAMVFADVNQDSPVRAMMTGSNADVSASVLVQSEAEDLVESTVAQGAGIDSPLNGQKVYVENSSNGDAADNVGASTALGSPPALAMSWKFTGADYWLMMAVSLEPAIP